MNEHYVIYLPFMIGGLYVSEILSWQLLSLFTLQVLSFSFTQDEMN